MDIIPKTSERISPCKPPAPWMTVIKGKVVPQSSPAARKPVPYPLGYAPVKLTKTLRGGGVSRDRAKREAHKAQKRQKRSGLFTLSGPSRLQHLYQVPRKKELEDELPTPAQRGHRVFCISFLAAFGTFASSPNKCMCASFDTCRRNICDYSNANLQRHTGLPHIHLCLILDFARMKMSMEDYIDDYISAEIPELPHDGDNSQAAKLQRLFRRFILDNMYHTCSPRYCLVDGKCTKHFPRPFAEQTVIDDRNVGVQYRRRPPAQSESERLQNPERYAFAVSGKDNRFVVPHNRFMALNINVEWIQGDACIKYVLKYVMKGCQLAFVQIVNDNASTTAGNVVVNYDEFRQIRMARYQTPNEALLSIWGNKIVRKSHQVQHQRFHLPGQNRIVVLAGQEEERAEGERERIEAEQDQQTPLTAYFTLNSTIGFDRAQQHTFLTICNVYWYDRAANQWKERAQHRKNHLSMLEAASAGNPEHQALRMLLLHVRGPTGWGDLYAGHATFVEAARAMGLLEDSSIWVNTILEALSGLPTFRRRLNWTAVLFANSAILDASSVLDRFPLRPGFVITTHKAQGQTLARVGVHLSSSQCFAHGQFYVAMSRVRSSDDIRVLTSARSSNCVQNWVVQAVVDKEDIEAARQYAGPIAGMTTQSGARALLAPRPPPSEPTTNEQSDGSSDADDDEQRPQQHRGRCQVASPSFPSGQQIFRDQQPSTSVVLPPAVQQLNRRIHIDRGLYFEDVLGDGDCFYRAIVCHLFGYGNGEAELSESDAMAQEDAQRSLRRAVARSIQQHYHFAAEEERQRMHYAVFPVDELPAEDPDHQLRQLFERAGIDNIPAYAQRIFHPAANDPAAWANANFEGLYAADVLARNIYVLDDVADANGRHQQRDLYILMPGFQQFRIERLTHNDLLAIMRTPRFVRRGVMQVVQQQNGPIEVQNPIIIRRQQNHFNAVHTSYRRQRTSTGLDRLSAVPAHQWSTTEDAQHTSPPTCAPQQLSPLLRVEVARQQDYQRMSEERASGQMNMLADDMENLWSPEKKRVRPSNTSPPRMPAFEQLQQKKAEKKKRWSEMMVAEGRRLLQQAEEGQRCEQERQAAEHQQLVVEQRRQKLHQRREHITQLWDPQTRASPAPTSFSAPHNYTEGPSPPQSPAPKGKASLSQTVRYQCPLQIKLQQWSLFKSKAWMTLRLQLLAYPAHS
uniref:OTU domain-containing protein n=1 Tax=Globodera pallida TaxID=36090 RepID=A0A183CF04_GLOPA